MKKRRSRKEADLSGEEILSCGRADLDLRSERVKRSGAVDEERLRRLMKRNVASE